MLTLYSQASTLLAQIVGTAVEWQIVVRSGVNTSEALDLVAASELRPADLLMTSLGTNDVTSQRPLRQFLDDYQTPVDTVIARAFISLQWADVAAQLARDGYHPGQAQYTYWARLVAERTAALMRKCVLLPQT